MKSLLTAGALTLTAALTTALPASAELISVQSNKSVSETLDALEVALGNAGATVFARIDHAKGAASIDAELAPSELLIFGNPKLGTPAMQQDPLAGLFLPLKALAYEDKDGHVFLTYEDPAHTLADLDVAADAPFIGAMQGALGKLTAAAAK